MAGRLRVSRGQKSSRGAKVQVGRQAQGQTEWSGRRFRSQERQGSKPDGQEKRDWGKAGAEKQNVG